MVEDVRWKKIAQHEYGLKRHVHRASQSIGNDRT